MLRTLVSVLILAAALPAHAANERALKAMRFADYQRARARPYYGTMPLRRSPEAPFFPINIREHRVYETRSVRQWESNRVSSLAKHLAGN